MDDNNTYGTDQYWQARGDDVISAIQRKKELPLRTREKIDELVGYFFQHLEGDIHCMLSSKYSAAIEIVQFEEDDEYYGLDSSRDTEEEVEAAIRLFPRVLSTIWPIRHGDYEYRDDDYENRKHPIQLLAFSRITATLECNTKAASFIPIVARLAIEFGSFEEDKRGGLLCEDTDGDNVLHLLMLSEHTPPDRHNLQHQIIDLTFSNVLWRLRRRGLLKKEDIQRYGLLNKLCCHSFFAKNRFQFLAKWDRNALTHTDEDGSLPLYHVVHNTSIQGFKKVFDYGIRYYPKKKGINLLFRKNNLNKTSFQRACERFGYEEVMKIVDDTLTSYADTKPINTEEALLSAAIDENIHLDSVYFLLRRQPDVLAKLLSSHSSSTGSVVTSTNNDNNNNNNRDSPSKRKGKRKRKRNINGTYRCRQKD